MQTASNGPARTAGAPLPLTGERTVPGVAEENYWFRRHEAAYHALRRYCTNAMVLEAGCGEGYGADLLSQVADRVIAVDNDPMTVAHVRAAYPAVHPLVADLAALPLRSDSIDVVASLQVIEHLAEQERFLAQCFRVLRPGGTLLVTTPNRITFSPGRDTPLNPFHTRELTAGELSDLLLGKGFTIERMAGLRHGPRLRTVDAAHGGSLIEAQAGVVVGYLPGQATWPPELLAAVTAVRAKDFEIADDNVDASLDLVAVARRPT